MVSGPSAQVLKRVEGAPDAVGMNLSHDHEEKPTFDAEFPQRKAGDEIFSYQFQTRHVISALRDVVNGRQTYEIKNDKGDIIPSQHPCRTWFLDASSWRNADFRTPGVDEAAAR